jgi:hypothetical protein
MRLLLSRRKLSLVGIAEDPDIHVVGRLLSLPRSGVDQGERLLFEHEGPSPGRLFQAFKQLILRKNKINYIDIIYNFNFLSII